MPGEAHQHGADRQSSRRWWQARWLQVSAALILLVTASLCLTAEYLLHNAEPILRKRIIETLSDRFDSPVELDRIDLSLFKGLQVNGWGLRIPFEAGRSLSVPAYPLLTVQHFSFRTSLRGLLRQPTHVAGVTVEGMEIHIPPAGKHKWWLKPGDGGELAYPGTAGLKPKIAITVGELHCRDVKLFLESEKPGRVPLAFNIASLEMRNLGRGQAMLYDAELTNPKPTGQIHAVGHFGPWAGGVPQSGERADPGKTPLDGDYTFAHADLNTIKGLGGTLSSKGHFAGVLDRITIDGETDVPNFSLDISDRPVPLHTQFHALVDGTSGDTYLQPVHARLGQSYFTVSGKIVKVSHQSHDIQLAVNIPNGRMQDFLQLAVKTDPPLMNGTLAMEAKLHIPPGNVRVPFKMEMAGAFHLLAVRFNNPKMQDRIDGLSARAQGKPDQVNQDSNDHETQVHSQLAANFTLGHGVMEASDVRYALPGALVLLNGVYSMDGRLFEFKGHVRTAATASQMIGGWQQWLVKPFDSLLKKNGAGLEVPIEISGTQGDMHLGLAMRGVGDTPAQMLVDVKQRDKQQRGDAAARRLMQQADEEDAAAAKAPTLPEAERAHQAAVQHRAQARGLLTATHP